MVYEYKTQGTCARKITVELDGKIIKNVAFDGGCNGNSNGLSKLVQGMDIDFVYDRLKGTRCGMKSTSCPDQLAIALRQAYDADKNI